MNYNDHAKRMGLNQDEIELIDKTFEQYKKLTKAEISKMIVILETKKSYLPLLFNYPVLAVTVAFGLPAIIGFILDDTMLKFSFVIIYLIYILIVAFVAIREYKKYTTKLKDSSMQLEICKSILSEME